MKRTTLLLYLAISFLLCSCTDPIHLLGLFNGEEESYDVPSEDYINNMSVLLERTHQNTLKGVKRFEHASAQDENFSDFKLTQLRMGVSGQASAGIGDYYNINGDLALELVLKKIK